MTPNSVDALYDEARPEPAFSNSADAEQWTEANCGTCIHDKNHRTDITAPGCPLILVALQNRRPIQWLAAEDSTNRYTCIEYRHENDGPDPEPQPIPDPPGQLSLVPREPYEGHRMLTLLPAPEPAPAT
ncbi:hypothetical protein [Streptomyces sp. NPDC001274]